jgi:hypothetical protein
MINDAGVVKLIFIELHPKSWWNLEAPLGGAAA